MTYTDMNRDQGRRDGASDAETDIAIGRDPRDSYLVGTIIARLNPNGDPYNGEVDAAYLDGYIPAYLEAWHHAR